MPRLYALADLHLSMTGRKPMDVFGEEWRDHATRMAEAWDSRVTAGDGVLLAGDLSWAENLAEAVPDLAWIAARPGKKLLLRGNHDSWWKSATKIMAAMPPGCAVLQNDAHLVAGRVVIGARGWVAPDDEGATEADVAVYRREIERLKLSIADADRRFGRAAPRIAMVHFPPWIEGRAATEVVAILRAAKVADCVYGHLHGADMSLGVTGERDGIRFHLVSADAVGFAPAEIPSAPLAGASR